MKNICIFFSVVIFLNSCNINQKKEESYKLNFSDQDTESLKTDLRLFTHFINEKKGLNEEYIVFPFYCMSKYISNSDFNLRYNYIDESTFSNLENEIITNRDIAQFSTLLPHLDSINSEMSKMSLPYPIFVSITFCERTTNNITVPEVSCNKIDLTNEENTKIVQAILPNADNQTIIIELAFQYSLNGKEGSKHFIFVKKNRKYKLIGIRAYGHI